MKKISITTLEKFRRYMCEASLWDTEQSLIDTLSSTFKGNHYTKIGNAFHLIVENGQSIVSDNSVLFNDEVIKFAGSHITAALLYKESMPNCFHEVKKRIVYNTKYGEVLLTAVADIIHGVVVRDIKTKYSDVHVADYTDSCQWKFYLEMFESNEFYFDLFKFDNYKKICPSIDVSSLDLIRVSPIHCIRYKGMEEDNTRLINEFLDYIEFRGLWHLLKDATEEELLESEEIF